VIDRPKGEPPVRSFRLVPIAFIILALALAASASAAAKEYVLLSPDKSVELKVFVGPDVTYAVAWRGRPIVVPSAVSLTVEGQGVLGKAATVRDEKRRSVDDILKPVVRQKAAEIRDRFNELTLTFEGSYALIFRAYDDGVAYRFATLFDGPITVISEQAEFAFGQDRSISRRRRASSPTRSAFSNTSA
jgi:alpha-glucosidase